MPKRHSAIVGEAKTYKSPHPAGGVVLQTFIPWKLVKRTVKREIITPLDAPEQFKAEAAAERFIHKESILVRAIGLAYYWQRLLDAGKVKSITEIAEREGLDKSHVSRLLKLTLLAPDIVQEIVLGRPRLSLHYFKKNSIPLLWEDQHAMPGIH